MEIKMSFTNIHSEAFTTPTMTTVRNSNKLEPLSVAVYKEANIGNRTYITLNKEVAKATGIRAGQRVSVLKGTGKDAGKVRIVANKKGSVKLHGLTVRSSKLFAEASNSMPRARETSFAKGALTIAV